MTSSSDKLSAVARNIKRERTKRGWSQEDLAREAGLHSSTVSKAERDFNAELEVSTRQAIAKAFGISEAELDPDTRSTPKD
jgi:transcriptional regulator with XRE-family HTH domain